MQIQPITEEAHNTAMLTLALGRQELLFYRKQNQELQQKFAQLEGHAKLIPDLRKTIEELEAKLVEAKSRITVHRLKYEDE
ncbi:hypothetical protein LCGC14_1061840 [marine sediment metagenome]|uniref:Uncharacterized protein n=1 Tax=marine sediment metagenome TaxID=412755 RepID=A0A0F9MKU4_9ZZZZ